MNAVVSFNASFGLRGMSQNDAYSQDIANVLPRCYLEKNPDQINRQKELEIRLNFNMLKLSDKKRKRFESIAGS